MKTTAPNFHEDLVRSSPVASSSDRHFGLVFGLAFAILVMASYRSGGRLTVPAALLSAAFLVIALSSPSWLHPLNKAWMILGVLLQRIVNPAVTSILFFLVFLPAGLVSRMAGRDPLRLKILPKAQTYWITRQPPGPAPKTMSKQF